MYNIYKTKGIILENFDHGESNKVYYILTHDFGLLAVFAQSVRKLSSKLKYSLQIGTLSSIDMVRGKEMWRITNAKFESNFFNHCDKDKLDLIMRIFTFIRRLATGESKNKKLFYITLQFLEFLNHTELWSVNDLSSLESIIKLRILHILGYGTSKKELLFFLTTEINTQILSNFKQYEKMAFAEINKALAGSHL